MAKTPEPVRRPPSQWEQLRRASEGRSAAADRARIRAVAARAGEHVVVGVAVAIALGAAGRVLAPGWAPPIEGAITMGILAAWRARKNGERRTVVYDRDVVRHQRLAAAVPPPEELQLRRRRATAVEENPPPIVRDIREFGG
jgi:hypothetical protein